MCPSSADANQIVRGRAVKLVRLACFMRAELVPTLLVVMVTAMLVLRYIMSTELFGIDCVFVRW
jgi:hypothetical protein